MQYAKSLLKMPNVTRCHDLHSKTWNFSGGGPPDPPNKRGGHPPLVLSPCAPLVCLWAFGPLLQIFLISSSRIPDVGRNGTSGIFENWQKTTLEVADLLLLWNDSSQFNHVWKRNVDVKMRMLQFFSVEKSGVISRWGQSVSDQDFHTCLFFTYNTLLLLADGQQSPKWLACEAPVLRLSLGLRHSAMDWQWHFAAYDYQTNNIQSINIRMTHQSMPRYYYYCVSTIHLCLGCFSVEGLLSLTLMLYKAKGKTKVKPGKGVKATQSKRQIVWTGVSSTAPDTGL